jgi:hypothetical protein
MIVAKLRIHPESMDDKIMAAAKNLVFGHIHPLLNGVHCLVILCAQLW